LQSTLRNQVIRRLLANDFDMVRPHLHAIDLPVGTSLLRHQSPVEHVYFPEAGIASITTITPEGIRAETGLMGRDGFSHVGAVVGARTSPYDIVMQSSGHGYRIESPALARALAHSPTLAVPLQRYAYALSVQTSYNALSNAVHHVTERLARWLLMCHDRTDRDDICLTHTSISVMLAVRRPSVTNALHILEGNGFIRSRRGVVLIRDRKGLEDFASDAYGQAEREYDLIMGPLETTALAS
jgi:CRP-like cAMP-binding protein